MTDYSKMSLAELREVVKARNIKGKSALKKNELVSFLSSLDAESEKKVAAENKVAAEKKSTPANKTATKKATGEKKSSPKETTVEKNATASRNAEKKNATKNPKFTMTVKEEQVVSGEVSSANQNRTKASEQNRAANQNKMQNQVKPDNHQVSSAAESDASRTDGVKQSDDNTKHNDDNTRHNDDRRKALDSGEIAEGILEIIPDGYGFIRSDNYLSGENDVYVSPSTIRYLGLRTGDIIKGNKKVKMPTERYQALLRVQSVNGYEPESVRRRIRFEELTPIFPDERIHLENEHCNTTPMRIMDLMCPVGKGQRGMIVSPPKAGKTTLVKQIAKSVSQQYPDMKIIVLLIDERPEEVTDIKESIANKNVEVIYSTFDELPEHHKRVSEMVLERAKRLVEHGEDVMILLDSITRLARAYNLTVQPSGRTLSGGLDPAALHMPKKFFGAARNIRNGGSLTILATALVETGSRMDDVVFEEFKGTGNMEMVLDRGLSERRIFPAIDIVKSGTRRDDLLLTEEERNVANGIHREIGKSRREDIVEEILGHFSRTRSNKDFMEVMRVALKL